MRYLLLVVITVLIFSCKEKTRATKVDYHFIPFYFGKIYLERLPFNEENIQVIDSAVIDYKTDHVSFTIPPQEESVFQLRIAGKPLKIYLINDVPHVIIHGSSTDPKNYSFKNAGINPVLKAFIDQQKIIVDQYTPIAEKARDTTSLPVQQVLMQQVDSLRGIYEKNARSFADTTKSPAAFLFAYNSVDFADDRKGLKVFISNAAKRFPDHKNVQVLSKETLDYISIYEEELSFGDQLSLLSLPDTSGIEKPVSAVGGKYTFIDLWSTWCTPCLSYIPVKKEAVKKIKPGKLDMISIAIDAEKDAWKQIVQQQELPGTHFIDEKMWRGKAAKAWKFDSIPFNFLISPEGKIIAKAIKPDSLIQVLTKFAQ